MDRRMLKRVMREIAKNILWLLLVDLLLVLLYWWTGLLLFISHLTLLLFSAIFMFFCAWVGVFCLCERKTALGVSLILNILIYAGVCCLGLAMQYMYQVL